jgi:hypothetical protein
MGEPVAVKRGVQVPDFGDEMSWRQGRVVRTEVNNPSSLDLGISLHQPETFLVGDPPWADPIRPGDCNNHKCHLQTRI